jgi:cell division protein FtsZ
VLFRSDDTLGDEVRITVIAAGFDGGLPKMRKVERKPFAEPSASAPAAASTTTSSSWFADSAVPATESIDVAEVSSYYANSSDTQAPSAFRESSLDSNLISSADEADIFKSNEPSKSQSADGTWGDDLDIPDFLR